MCDWCGCRDIAVIKNLGIEHDFLLAIISELYAAYEANDLNSMVYCAQEIASVLKNHTIVEEQGIFAYMRDDFPERIATLEAEHKIIDEVLAEATDGSSIGPTWPKRVVDAMHMMGAHIYSEENDVFPAAQQYLSYSQLDEAIALYTRLNGENY